jgi:hypothetical protein
MRRRYEPRPNHARLLRKKEKRESWQSDFRGEIVLQDGVEYFVGVTRRTTFAEEEFLAIYLRPIGVSPANSTWHHNDVLRK